mgnify:CR=1 FL=1
MGLATLDDNPEDAIEIVVNDPEAMSINIGGVEINLTPQEDEQAFDANLAEDMDESELMKIATEIEIGRAHV